MNDQTKEKIEIRKNSRKSTAARNGSSTVERTEEYENIDSTGIVREQRVTKNSASERIGWAQKLGQLVWMLSGVLEAVLGLRFLLKLIAANPGAPFVQIVYSFTDLFLWPFTALTATPSTEQGMVLEIPTLFAMLVYGLVAWAVVKLLHLFLIPSSSETVTVFRREES